MPMCLIVGCSRKTGGGKGVRLFRVPAIITNQGPEVEKLSIERRRLWISAISRADLTDKILNSDKVCDQHFHSGTAAPLWDRYNIDWVPTLNLGHDKTATQSEQHQAQSREARAERSKERRKRHAEQQEQERSLKQQKLNEPGVPLADFAAEIESASTSSEQVQVENLDLQPTDQQESDPNEQATHSTCSTQTQAFDYLYCSVESLSIKDCPRSDASTQTEEFDYLFAESVTSKPFDKNYFKDDNGKVSFYTGLPTFEVLEATFNHVAPHVKRRTQSLFLFQEMVMVLMKLRLNLPHQDLAYRFGVSMSTVSRTFAHWLVIMDVRLSPLIRWPEREELWKTMPQCFKFSLGNKTTVIIDCFEVFCVKPTNLLARAQTFSSYKHHNTVKVLIGITPQGCISFVSEAWGGRTSDKYLTENCGLLNNLLPGDLVIADRGFTVHDGVALKQAKLIIPAFTKGKEQLDPVDVERTRGIAHVRIHVERVIGLLRRKYTILESTLSVDFLTCNPTGNPEIQVPMIDRILRVCSGLVNLCGPIVPFD
ncbi:uncharacterized protein [Montipora foliosa]|uniref:uncharacterized protein n=1 Tax=Montipora foliosa TaxID=591990 RepID=UPI0035F118C2